MSTESKGRDLFIVDNSVFGWTGLRYLDEWTGIAKAFDIATGYFEIGALLALDGKWQALEKIRILMGAEMTHRTRKALLDAVRSRGVFVCYALPALDREAGEFTEEAGTTRWYLCELDRDTVLEEPSDIVASIRSKPDTPRKCTTEEKTLVEIRAKVEKHIKNTYLKRVDAPVGVKPALRCWMELNE
ncbi:MAG: hypothetical protein A3H32_19180 [Betaproteobacteria bacterium RIFCSPLOWO2_02_FULL_63_19]|nr:MAG: hypothetical protein A3H32_19180 [Betaproteobacteria bacterium RIFCSPLOWO2_02_FULL_63_19]